MWIGGVRVIITDGEKKILMVRQHHEGRDIWMAPGGGIEDGETAVQAAVREIKEETGLEVTVGRLIWHVEQVTEKKGQRFVNFFLGEIEGGSLEVGRDPEREGSTQVLREVRFMGKDELSRVDVLYPEYLKDELWDFFEGNYRDYDAFKIRR